ncbi:MAG: response regulator transcription factor [Actinobacteria bacterium]|nr:MAG: response regulator transcription factor [Actinomycetota bacterium]
MARARVLIVEDEADLAWVEQFNLESEGYEVEVAFEGRTAIEALHSFEPDVVLLDLMLPHVDGWSVLAEARELPDDQRPHVILVSAVAGVQDQARALEMGAGWFLAKPFDMEDLLRMVGETVTRNGAV